MVAGGLACLWHDQPNSGGIIARQAHTAKQFYYKYLLVEQVLSALVSCAFSGFLFSVYAGWINTNGNFNVGTNGNYWSSTLSTATNAHRLNFNSTNMNVNTNNKGNGFSVRCVL